MWASACVFIWPKSIAFTTTLQFAKLKVYIIYRKVLKPKIGRSLEVESKLTATNPCTESNMQVCYYRPHVPTQRINLRNKLRLLILVHSPNPKSENWKHCHCDTFCSFLSKYFPFQVQFFLHRLQKKSHSFQNVWQFLYRFSVALRFHRRFVFFFSVFVRFQRRINGKCFVKYMKLLVKATKIYGLSVADFIRKRSSIKLWAGEKEKHNRLKNVSSLSVLHVIYW